MASVDFQIPHNDVAEAALLGALLFAPNTVDTIRDIVRPMDFYTPVHRAIFEAICAVSDSGKSPSPAMLKPFLDGNGDLKAAGGMTYLVDLASHAASVINAREVAGQLRELGQRRALIEAMAETIHRACKTDDFDDQISSIMEDADCSLTAILNRELTESAGIKQVSAAQAFEEMMEDFHAAQSGVTCGDIASLDEQLGPIRPHHLAIMAGRPGMGKTAAALCYAIGAARRGHGVLFVTLEMNRLELMQRAASALIFDGHRGVPYELIRDGRAEGNDLRALASAGRAFRDLPINIVDAGSLTIGRLNAIVRRWKRRMAAKGQSLDLVVVDYLQLLHPDSKTRSTVEAVSEVSRGLKAIAKTHDLGVLALAQLNRGVEQREDKRPMLSDLRDSGQIEQDADAVVFLYRQEYYLRLAEPKDEVDKIEWQRALDAVSKKIDFIVAKRRNGTTGTARGEFHGAFMAVRG
ncbi:replicative DNA helicase [Sphingobium jiangsuense]|uniref:DNA 5'-3' helicase n=1 Tax=Sphingobium jiangsuense TaxID=870476 RepID=A0A7W6BL27_9SPHN|nr:DnaB-like helicase C-terminal domain-containing protein [Sphingobium jiangsuense]MBB3927844.1 replicative DNA helicase [Sphingobium jiangsuense]GLT02951.1 replicative DNA helicase [Sphingobium jiangsuense]